MPAGPSSGLYAATSLRRGSVRAQSRACRRLCAGRVEPDPRALPSALRCNRNPLHSSGGRACGSLVSCLRGHD